MNSFEVSLFLHNMLLFVTLRECYAVILITTKGPVAVWPLITHWTRTLYFALYKYVLTTTIDSTKGNAAGHTQNFTDLTNTNTRLPINWVQVTYDKFIQSSFDDCATYPM